MIAVVKIGGHQEIVKVGDKLEVDKLSAKVDEKVVFETLLVSEEDGSGFKIGTPVLAETVEAKVLEHGRGTKIKVFKMKPRKRYRRTQGHRQDYTLIEITKIAGKTTTPKKVVAKKIEKVEKKVVKKATPKKVVTKKAPVKKTVAKKKAVKKEGKK
jgi:large subunit ribosomal protein L21